MESDLPLIQSDWFPFQKSNKQKQSIEAELLKNMETYT